MTWDPIISSLIKSANDAFDIGFLGKTRPDLSGIYNLKFLNEVLKDKVLQIVNESPRQDKVLQIVNESPRSSNSTTAAANASLKTDSNSINATK